MVLQMTDASSTTGFSPSRCALMAVARPQGPPPTMTRSQSDDLVTPCSHAHVRDRRVDELAHAIQVAARFGGQIFDATRVGRRPLPARHPLVLRLRAIEHRDVRGKLLVELAIDLVAGA